MAIRSPLPRHLHASIFPFGTEFLLLAKYLNKIALLLLSNFSCNYIAIYYSNLNGNLFFYTVQFIFLPISHLFLNPM